MPNQENYTPEYRPNAAVSGQPEQPPINNRNKGNGTRTRGKFVINRLVVGGTELLQPVQTGLVEMFPGASAVPLQLPHFRQGQYSRLCKRVLDFRNFSLDTLEANIRQSLKKQDLAATRDIQASLTGEVIFRPAGEQSFLALVMDSPYDLKTERKAIHHAIFETSGADNDTRGSIRLGQIAVPLVCMPYGVKPGDSKAVLYGADLVLQNHNIEGGNVDLGPINFYKTNPHSI